MIPLSDAAVARLRGLDDLPVFRDGRYEVLGELGRGGMGVVYRVRDTALGREVALKVVTPGATGNDPAGRLWHEARAIARLEHPGIVAVHDVGQLADERVFYTMKLVHGHRLDQRMAQGISLGDGLRVVTRICDAVAFAHAHGVIHRDLKPQNVMVAPFGEVLVMDWGVARVVDEMPRAPSSAPPSAHARAARPTTGDGVILGTPGYMAPEQAAGDSSRVDQRADVFALGVILREVAAGAADRAAVPPPLSSIIAKATAVEPHDRYPDAGALGRDVSAFLDRLPVEAHAETLRERIARLALRHRVALGLVFAYLLVRVLMLAVL